jgi:hypothetical protein
VLPQRLLTEYTSLRGLLTGFAKWFEMTASACEKRDLGKAGFRTTWDDFGCFPMLDVPVLLFQAVIVMSNPTVPGVVFSAGGGFFGDYPAGKTVVLDPIEPVSYERATVFSTGPGERSSHHTLYRRPHVRHSYQPCAGHIASSCMSPHQRFAIRAMSSIQSSVPANCSPDTTRECRCPASRCTPCTSHRGPGPHRSRCRHDPRASHYRSCSRTRRR